jgi:hypothetical protein
MAFKAQVAIRLQNIDTPMMFIWFLLASRLSIKLHNAKHLRSACDACSVSPPWTRTGMVFCVLVLVPLKEDGVHQKNIFSSKEFQKIS